MKYYHVSLPVWACVDVFVKAESKEQAEQIASKNASLRDAEPIDFSNADADVDEIDIEQEEWRRLEVYDANGKVNKFEDFSSEPKQGE